MLELVHIIQDTMEGSTQLFARMAFLCLIAWLDGMVDSCLGPALRDLQCIFNVTLEKVSLILPVITACRVIGSLLFLKIRDRFNIFGLAATTITMSTWFLAVVPVVPSFWMALGLSGAVGLTYGIAMHGKMVLSGELSKQHAASIHIINLASSAGAVIGPLIMSPFLSDNPAHNNHTEPAFHDDNMTFISQNSTAQGRDYICHNFSSDVMYGFFVIAGLGMVVLPCYLLTQLVIQKTIIENVNQLEEKHVSTVGINDGVFVILIMIYSTICATMIFVYGQFLPTFGIHSKLHASTRQMTTMSLSFYMCIMFGRLFGTLGSFVIKQFVLINVCTAGAIMTSVMLIYVSERDFIWMWIGTSILAVACAPMSPAVSTWALDVNRHRTILYGILSVADMLGYAVLSLLTGQLMANVFVQIINYVMVSILLIQMVTIMSLYLTTIVSKRANSENQGYLYIK